MNLAKVAPNLGAAVAGGIISSGTLKATSGLPPVQRLMTVVSFTVVGAAGFKLGLALGETILKFF
jgi:hypothetical protein